jgi:hypothetical protein
MKKIAIGFVGLLITALSAGPAMAWSHANRYGGSSAGHYGEGSEHTNAWGGSSAHAYGGGSEHTNMYGGKSAGEYGEGAVHTNPYGGSSACDPASLGGLKPIRGLDALSWGRRTSGGQTGAASTRINATRQL